MKLIDDEPDEHPRCYHLVHWKLKDLTPYPTSFPLEARWEGAKYDERLTIVNDIICKAYTRRLTCGRLVAEGIALFGKTGSVAGSLTVLMTSKVKQ